jgi:anti-sigma regulatory factor (Ser/Thr protein kinase)
MMTQGAQTSFPILREADVLSLRTALQNMAKEVGFALREREELLLVVQELASNLLKHAQGGRILLTALASENKKGLEIESLDDGPGIADPELALTDGYSTAGSLGYGLGTVNRLADEMELTSTPGIGSRVVCRRWLRPKADAFTPNHLEFGVVTRALNNAGENGDAFVVKRWNHHALGAVIDGLGHGPFASKAASAARTYIESHYDQPLDSLLRGANRACRATRGAVVALAAVRGETELDFSGIGNIGARLLAGDKSVTVLSMRGVVGGEMPPPKIMHHTWGPDHVLVLHSDGIKAEWRWTDFPGLEHEKAQAIARRLFQALARDRDDATVLVMKGLST